MSKVDIDFQFFRDMLMVRKLLAIIRRDRRGERHGGEHLRSHRLESSHLLQPRSPVSKVPFCRPALPTMMGMTALREYR